MANCGREYVIYCVYYYFALVSDIAVFVLKRDVKLQPTITLPAGAVVKYCDEYVCLCLSVCLPVCLSVREDISGTTRAIFTQNFVHVAYIRGSVLLWYVDDRPHRLSPGKKRNSIYIAPFAPRYTQSAQAWITQYYLQTTPCLPFLRGVHQMSPPQQLRHQTSNCSSILIYRPRKDERLSWP